MELKAVTAYLDAQTVQYESIQWNWKTTISIASSAVGAGESIQWNWKFYELAFVERFVGVQNPFNGIERVDTIRGVIVTPILNPFNGIERGLEVAEGVNKRLRIHSMELKVIEVHVLE